MLQQHFLNVAKPSLTNSLKFKPILIKNIFLNFYFSLVFIKVPKENSLSNMLPYLNISYYYLFF